MPEETKPAEGETKPTAFTQDDVNRFVAEERRKTQERFQDYDDLKSKATELETLKAEGQSEQEKAITKARKEAEEAARSDERGKADARIVKAEVRALAGTRFANPTDAVAILQAEGQLADLKVNDDGEVDEKVITARLDKLLEDRPYLKAGTAGNGGGSGGLGNLGQGQRQPAGKQTGRERGLAEAERRFGKKAESRT